MSYGEPPSTPLERAQLIKSALTRERIPLGCPTHYDILVSQTKNVRTHDPEKVVNDAIGELAMLDNMSYIRLSSGDFLFLKVQGIIKNQTGCDLPPLGPSGSGRSA